MVRLLLGAGKEFLPRVCSRDWFYDSIACHEMGFFSPLIVLLDLGGKSVSQNGLLTTKLSSEGIGIGT